MIQQATHEHICDRERARLDGCGPMKRFAPVARRVLRPMPAIGDVLLSIAGESGRSKWGYDPDARFATVIKPM